MGLLIPIGIGLFLLASLGGKKKTRAALPPTSTAPIPTQEALARAEQGVATSEDYSALADEAERTGDPDVAERMREQADSPPTPPGVPGPTVPETKPAEALDTPSEDPAEAAEEEREVQAAPPPPTVDPAEAATPPAPAPAPTADPTNPDPSFTPPTGFDPSKASSMAQGLNDHIAATQYSYNRGRVKDFQKAAGIAADGHYGPGTHAALAFYGVNNPTRGLFRGSTTTYPETLAYWAQRMGYTP